MYNKHAETNMAAEEELIENRDVVVQLIRAYDVKYVDDSTPYAIVFVSETGQLMRPWLRSTTWR